MKEHPILFSGPMIRAIQAGRKSQTRRVIKPQPHFIESSGRWSWDIPKSKIVAAPFVCTASREWWEYLLPSQFPYQVGDQLWVRENWRYDDFDNSMVIYQADMPAEMDLSLVKWKPSIHMFRKDSRITLEITDIRVQQIQNISPEDCLSEGMEYRGNSQNAPFNAYADFRALWIAINGKKYPWVSNPWVRAVTFRRI